MIAAILQSPILTTWKNGLLTYLVLSMFASWYVCGKVGKFLGHFGHDYLYSYSIAFLIPVLYPIVVIEIFIKNIIKERKVSIHMIVNAITVEDTLGSIIF